MGSGKISLFLLMVMLGSALSPAAGAQGAPHVAILGVGMAGAHTLRIEVATTGLETEGAAPPTVDLAVWLDGVPARATLPLIHMPSRFGMDFDLPAGIVRVGGVTVGTFQPVPPFTDNLRFPVEVTVRRGPLVATARREATILLPTVIVPGYLNEMGGPDREVLDTLGRHGYVPDGPAPTLFWWSYSSRQLSLDGGAQALAAYVRRAVLPATYAAKINVIGYSVGGLMARWNVGYDVDGWGTLVNRLVLVGVPNEGAVMAYVGEHAPAFLPFSAFGKTPLARALTPTFPFWRPAPGQPWSMPPDGANTLLAGLNARALPRGMRVYIFYGSHDPRDSAGPQTEATITGLLPGGELTYEAGDGIVLAASAEGLPIHGGDGVAALADRVVLRVDLGAVYHLRLLDAGADRIAGALLDRFLSTVDEAPPES